MRLAARVAFRSSRAGRTAGIKSAVQPQSVVQGRRSFHQRPVSRAANAAEWQDPNRTAVIVAAGRTAIGSFNGALAPLSATEIASQTIKGVLAKSQVQPEWIDEAILGNVVSANTGQAPTRQAILGAGIPVKVPATTINKVCSSGMKSVMFAAQTVMAGQNRCVLAGGFESMSNIPYYLPKGRNGMRLGHGQVIDGLIRDGLWDPHDDHHMGNCAEAAAKKYGFSREDQDKYAVMSYERAQAASKNGLFKEEIIPIEIQDRKGTKVFDTDEDPFNLKMDKVPTLRPAFAKDGTVTAANASSINDGAANLIVTSLKFAQDHNLSPLARIVSFGDAARAPIEFTIAPSDAIPIALARGGLSIKDVDYFEINEAFSVVSLANNKLLDLDPDRVNVNGGSVAIGHPIGASGARILVTLLHVLQQKDARIGVAGICNGGGGASAIVVERM